MSVATKKHWQSLFSPRSCPPPAARHIMPYSYNRVVSKRRHKPHCRARRRGHPVTLSCTLFHAAFPPGWGGAIWCKNTWSGSVVKAARVEIRGRASGWQNCLKGMQDQSRGRASHGPYKPFREDSFFISLKSESKLTQTFLCGAGMLWKEEYSGFLPQYPKFILQP